VWREQDIRAPAKLRLCAARVTLWLRAMYACCAMPQRVTVLDFIMIGAPTHRGTFRPDARAVLTASPDRSRTQPSYPSPVASAAAQPEMVATRRSARSGDAAAADAAASHDAVRSTSSTRTRTRKPAPTPQPAPPPPPGSNAERELSVVALVCAALALTVLPPLRPVAAVEGMLAAVPKVSTSLCSPSYALRVSLTSQGSW